MPVLSQIHIDRALTDVSIAYRNENYIAEDVAPILPVAKRTDKYFVYNQVTFLSSAVIGADGFPKSLRRPKAEANEVDFAVSNAPYVTEEYAERELVTDAETAYADNPLQPDIDATIMLTERFKITNELMTARMVGNPGSYPTAGKVTLTTGG